MIHFKSICKQGHNNKKKLHIKSLAFLEIDKCFHNANVHNAI